MTADTLPNHFVNVSRIPENGRSETLSANPDQLGSISGHIGVTEVEMLEADLQLDRFRSGGARVDGRLQARIVQPCVVTLEPLTQEIDVPIAMTFLPADQIAQDVEVDPKDKEMVLDAEEEDPPEPLGDNSIDLWAVVLEALILEVDHFPRKEGATVEHIEDEADETESPFAALESLRSNRNPAR